MTVLRRFLVLTTLMFWQGGFTFYAAVVVPVGSAVLGSHLEQGLVTRSVTNFLNLAGVAALVVLGWDIASAPDPGVIRRRLRWALLTLSVLALGLLVWLHLRLDDLLDLGSSSIVNRPRFRELHKWYLHISTIQWVASLILAAATLRAWRSEDMRPPLPAGDAT